MFFKIIFAVQK